MANEYTLADEIEEGARDELPETFDALVESENFGAAGSRSSQVPCHGAHLGQAA
jgi:hypothetical protein